MPHIADVTILNFAKIDPSGVLCIEGGEDFKWNSNILCYIMQTAAIG